MRTYIKLVIRFRLLILAMLFCITLGAGYVISHGVFATSVAKLFLGNDPEYYKYQDRVSRFASDEVLIMAFEEENLLSVEHLNRLTRVVESIFNIEDVAHVESILKAQFVVVEGDTLHVRKYTEQALEHPDKAGELLEKLRTDEQYSGLFVSENGKHSALIVELTLDANRAAERGPLLVNEVWELFEREGYQPEKVHCVGMLASLSEILHQTELNIQQIFPFVCLILLIAVYIMFRRFWPVIITLVVSLIAVIWSVGFAVLLDPNISIFISMVPAVILIVATSDSIHLCSAYMLELGRGLEKREAILKSGSEVGAACLMTSATTFFGFIALSFVPTPAFKQLGVVLGFGVAAALLLAMSLTPILFHYMKAPEPWRDDSSRIQDLLSRSLFSMERFCISHPWMVVLFFVIMFAAAAFGLSELNIETDMSKRLEEDNKVRIDEDYFNRHFAGFNFLEIFIDADQDKGLLDPQAFAAIAAYQKKLEAMPEVDKAVSLVDLIETIHLSFNPEADWSPDKPLTRAHLAQYLMLFEMGGGEQLGRMVDRKRRSMRMAVRLNDNAMRATYQSGLEAKRLSEEIFENSLAAESTGMIYLMGRWLDRLVDGQRRGLTFAFFSIAILMVIGLRSFRVGALSMIPNALPLLWLGGFVGLLWDQVDSDTLSLAMIAIGIGVDDTIHFLMRLRFESAREKDPDIALRRAYQFSGRAIIITTIILVAGFAPFAISDYYSIRILGTLLPMTLVVALAADLLLVPALAKIGIIRFRRP